MKKQMEKWLNRFQTDSDLIANVRQCIDSIEPLDDSKAQMFESIGLWQWGYENNNTEAMDEARYGIEQQVGKAYRLQERAPIKLVSDDELKRLEHDFSVIADMMQFRSPIPVTLEDFIADTDKWMTEAMYIKFCQCLGGYNEKGNG